MSATIGRKVTLTPTDGGPTLTGMRSKSITIGDTEIDITTDDSAGWRELLPESGERMVDIAIDALVKDDGALAGAFGTGPALRAYTIDIDGIGEFSGTFRIPSGGVDVTATYNEAVGMSFTIKSSGEVTYSAST